MKEKDLENVKNIKEKQTNGENLKFVERNILKIYEKRLKNEDNVECQKCGYKFKYNSIPESGMGYVKCPKCNKPVTQKK